MSTPLQLVLRGTIEGSSLLEKNPEKENHMNFDDGDLKLPEIHHISWASNLWLYGPFSQLSILGQNSLSLFLNLASALIKPPADVIQ